MFNPSLKPFFVQPRMGKETLRFSNAWHSWNSPSVFRGATDVGGRHHLSRIPRPSGCLLIIQGRVSEVLTPANADEAIGVLQQGLK
jgi:hypothetical protein